MPAPTSDLRPATAATASVAAVAAAEEEPTSTVERVVQDLRRAIFEGEIESGAPLREVAIAEAHGVSRPTVREAFAVLVAEGLAAREPNRGVQVVTPEAASVRDVCAARFVLEGAGVLGWEDAEEGDRDHVRRSLRAYTDAVRDDGSYEDLNALHLAFHVSLVGLTGSPRLVAMAEALTSELRLALAQVERIARNAHDEADTHVALVDLLERGDVGDAHRFLRGHLRDAEREIIGALGLT